MAAVAPSAAALAQFDLEQSLWSSVSARLLFQNTTEQLSHDERYVLLVFRIFPISAMMLCMFCLSIQHTRQTSFQSFVGILSSA
jgi:hypothetical protein